MRILSTQDILDQIEKPSRYLGTEINRTIKDRSVVDLRMALAFPDLYEIGMSHFGIQILYHLLNAHKQISAERVFAPAVDMAHQLRQNQIALSSLETGTPLDQFDMIGFSLLYELNYTNVLNMLDLARIPLRAADRGKTDPMIIAGGPCVCNPEPMAEFFDAMVFGDGESVIMQLADSWLAWKRNGSGSKIDLLTQWSRLEGVYIPQFFDASWDASGYQRLAPKMVGYTAVRRAIVTDLDQIAFPDRPIVPFGRPVHDRLRLEIARGCTRGCRFCQAGMIYRPVRERSPEKLLDMARDCLAATGFEDLSLLSLSTGDYGCLSGLMQNLLVRCRKERVAISLPSLRAGTLTPELMQMIKTVRKTGFTIAPEAGSQRLRDVINKNITFEDVSETVEDAFRLGWQVIKLYFMIGLPGETDTDVLAIIDMVRELKKIKSPTKRRGQINVSVTPFVPKPHTPFQWASQISMQEANQKLEQLKKGLKMAGIHLKWQNPQMSVLEGVLARGDRRLSGVIETAWRSGCTFDGWSDQFNFSKWHAAFEKCGVDIDFYTARQRSVEEPLPWDHMDARVDKRFLSQQWQAAFAGELLPDCRHGACHQCGVCDFVTLQPKTFSQCPVSEKCDLAPAPEVYAQWELIYRKMGAARFFGHLELVNIFSRAFRRAEITLQYSQGFHPMPRLSFDDPLPLGMESEAERMRIFTHGVVDCSLLLERLNRQLPEGIEIIDCRSVSQKRGPAKENPYAYKLTFTQTEVDQTLLDNFNQADSWPYVRSKHNSGSISLDLKACVRQIQKIDSQTLYLELVRNGPRIVRPADVLMGIFNLFESDMRAVRVLKLAKSVGESNSKVL
jgi:radical SAM family uncharacterized protein/radical SAM-linked protein